MPPNEQGGGQPSTLRITVDDWKVKAERMEDRREARGDLALSPLKRETISALIAMLRENRLLPQEYGVLGMNLYSVLFEDEQVASLLKNTLGAGDLRVELEFEEPHRDLAGWPWEYMYRPLAYGQVGGGQFLAERPRFVLTRKLRLDEGFRSLKVPDAELPLRVLFVAPSPTDLDRVVYTDVLEELRDLEQAVNTSNEPGQKDRLDVFPLVDPDLAQGEHVPDDYPFVTWDAFRNQVDQLNPHIIHFLGHGQFRDEDDKGSLALDKVDRKADWVRDKTVATQLESSPDLRLVFLQACESGEAAINPYQAVSGVAMELAHRNIPAVVAMQYRVKNNIANRFAKVFYHSLTAPMAVDLAVRAGRLEIGGRPEDFDQAPVLGLPVLYLREYESLLAPGVTAPPKAPIRGSAPSAPTTAADTVSPADICSNCHAPRLAGKRFCAECGFEFEQPEPGFQAAPPAPPVPPTAPLPPAASDSGGVV